MELSSVPSKKWMFAVALFSHFGWGVYPVLSRYLSVVGNLPTLSLVAIGNIPAILIGRNVLELLQLNGRGFLPTDVGVRRRFPQRNITITAMVILIVTLRSVCNIASTNLASAIINQLITLFTPFMVAIISCLVQRESLPKYTIPAMIVSFFGSLMILFSSQLETTDRNANINNNSNDSVNGNRHTLGILLAFVGTVLQAVFMVMVKQLSKEFGMNEQDVMSFIIFPSGVIGAVLSLYVGESWSPYWSLSLSIWLVLILFCVVRVSSQYSQVKAIHYLGAPMVSTLMPVRLASAIVISVIFLSEGFSSFYEVLGTTIVVITVSVYLKLNLK